MLTFAAPAFLWGLLALPLVVLLHRLRVRRPRREVAGLFLWRQAREVGARRPRFHAGLLLLLQLLAVTGVVTALARPQLRAEGPVDRVIVIDASASMLATDAPAAATGEGAAPADRSRFDAAIDRAGDLVEGAGRVAVVRAGREPTVVLPFTNDRVRIRGALAELRAGDAGSDAGSALRTARDVARAAGPAAEEAPAGAGAEAAAGSAAAEIHWLSDAPPPATAGLVVHPFAGTGANVGVTGFELVAGQAWIRLSSTAPGPVAVPVELLRGEASVARTESVVPARGDVSLTLPLGEGTGAATVRIEPPADDALAIDDVAHAGTPTLEVGLEAPFAALERALGAVPGVRARVGPGTRSLPLDLRVLVDDDPAAAAAAIEAGAALALPPREGPAVAAEVLDWDRADPLLRFVDLRELVVALPDPPPLGEEDGWTTLVRGVPLAATDGAGAPAAEGVEGLGGAPGADAAGAGGGADAPEPAPVPLVQRRDAAGPPVLRFAFHPARGDLTLRPAFPTFVTNLVDAVRGAPRIALGAPLPPGATRAGEPAAVALEPGFYDVDGRTVHASLLSEAETRLPDPAAFADDAAGAATGAAEAPAEAGTGAATSVVRDLLPVLAAVVLLLLLLEWWGFVGGGVLRPRLPGTRRTARGRPS